MKKPVVVLGRLDRLEICSVERYDRSMSAGEQSFSEATPPQPGLADTKPAAANDQ